MQWRALEEHRIANNQVDSLAKQGAASGRPPQALTEAHLERAGTTRRYQEMAIENLEERDHLEDIAAQAEQEPGVRCKNQSSLKQWKGGPSHQAPGWM